MKLVWKIGVIALLIAITACDAYSKSWRGIVPFHSTRADIDRILGKTPCQDENGIGYSSGNEDVYFVLAPVDVPTSCGSVTAGTVLRIEITTKKQLRISDLGLEEKRLIELSTSSLPSDTKAYIDAEEGVVVRTQSGLAEAIFYVPGTRDRGLCPILYIDPAILVTPVICHLCPTIAVIAAKTVQLGSFTTFTLRVSGTGRCTHPTIKWSVTVGQIVEGQGTTTIKVDTKGITDNRVIAIVQVDGLDLSCANTASAWTEITSHP